jgi:hypothetical protein
MTVFVQIVVNVSSVAGIFDDQYFWKRLRSGDFSRFLAERLKSLLRFPGLPIMPLQNKTARTLVRAVL